MSEVGDLRTEVCNVLPRMPLSFMTNNGGLVNRREQRKKGRGEGGLH